MIFDLAFLWALIIAFAVLGGIILGAVGVIGPTRLNYGRIVPIVDYTAQLVGRLVSDRGK